MVQYTCAKCSKLFNHKGKYEKHLTRKNPCFYPIINPTVHITPTIPTIMDDKQCCACFKIFVNKSSRVHHEKISKCFYKKIIEDEIKEIKELENNKNNDIPNELKEIKEKNCKLEEKLVKLELMFKKVITPTPIIKPKHNLESNINYPINNQLINLIIDKTHTIGELKDIINNKEISNEITTLFNNTLPTLNINDVVIVSRNEDNYINANQLCQAGNKKFNDWFHLDSTTHLITTLENDLGNFNDGIFTSYVIDKGHNNESSWIHPDLAIQLAQWISPIFALQVSKWLRTLCSNGAVSINIKLLEDHQNEINLKDQKIKLLEDTYVKKQHRKDYPEKNVIYMLTTEDNKNKRVYIIGKAKDLKNRLSTYNKTTEHEVVYYKECKSEEDMNIIEGMVLNKLKEYKEQANRDRFVLPIENDIIFFINIINVCINFYN